MHPPDTQQPTVKVLLIEDKPGDTRRIQEILGDKNEFDLLCVDRLSAGLERLAEEAADVVLLDLDLPDSQGLYTFIRVRDRLPQAPVIVLTEFDDEKLALKTIREGVQDYLSKGQIEPHVLVRSIRYAIERHRLLAELERVKQQNHQNREFHSLERLTHSPQTSVTAKTFGLGLLRESASETFNECVQRYEELIELALEQSAYKVEHNISEGLRALAEQIGFLRAGPRDVVDIHSTALKRKCRGVTSLKAQAYLEEGRLLVLELMGCLVSCYRPY